MGASVSSSYFESPQFVGVGDSIWLIGSPALAWDSSGRVSTTPSGDSVSAHFAAAVLHSGASDSLAIERLVPLPQGVWRMSLARAAREPNGGVSVVFAIPEVQGRVGNATDSVLASSWRGGSWTAPRSILGFDANVRWNGTTVSQVAGVGDAPSVAVFGSKAGRSSIFLLTLTSNGWESESRRHPVRLYPQVLRVAKGPLVVASLDADTVSGVAGVFVAISDGGIDSLRSAVLVSPHARFSAYSPQLVHLGDSTLALAWLESGSPPVVRLQISRDNARSWQQRDSIVVPFRTRRIAAAPGDDRRLHLVAGEEGGQGNGLFVATWNGSWKGSDQSLRGRLVGYPSVIVMRSRAYVFWSEAGPHDATDGLPRTFYLAQRTCPAG